MHLACMVMFFSESPVCVTQRHAKDSPSEDFFSLPIPNLEFLQFFTGYLFTKSESTIWTFRRFFFNVLLFTFRF